MTDPGSSMSLTAVLALTVVVLVLMGAWLGVLFFVAREPGGSAAQRAGGAEEGAATPGRPGQ